MNIQDIVGYYDPLQYPLLLPYGTYGWDINIRNMNGTQLTCLNYYAYMLQIRENSPTLLLRGARLLQQYVVDNYIKIETQRLRWIRSNQRNIRFKLYQGLQDCLDGRENNAGNVGHRIVLPSSFTGSSRDMYQQYQDAMTLEFKKDIVDRGVLGKVQSYSYVIEYQKRGLPQAHTDKLQTHDDFDSVVRAEIPSQTEEPNLYEIVIHHMIHGSCGALNTNSPCMRDGKCKKKFSKSFVSHTYRGMDSYPLYRRREGTQVQIYENDQIMFDNGWVVPYNPWFLLKYDCHINVEVCGGIKCVKYIYKYIHKGPGRVALEVRNGHNFDEIQQYVDGRWISAPEAFWRIFSFELSRMYPAVIRLQFHLSNQHSIQFHSNQHISDVLANDANTKTMLTEFFQMNCVPELTGKYLYKEFRQYFTWINSRKEWVPRRSRNQVVESNVFINGPVIEQVSR
ncbi:uncharacterized protein [Henckelia pumila]|uniref:uncharacterized protein n=1 Tax=Henckelia pumila TaxID=405737 RepID=UPI003C6E7E34